MLAITSPFPQFFDTAGDALDNGSIFIGVANQNPETTPQQCYWDVAGTQPAASPLKTLDGYIVRAGTPTLVYVPSDYSMSVRDSKGRLVYYAASSVNFTNSALILAQLAAANGSTLVGWQQLGTGAVVRTVSDKLREQLVSVKDFGAVGDGATDDTAAINACFAYCNQQQDDYIANPPDFFKTAVATVYFPRGDYIYSGTGISPGYWICGVRGEDKATTRLKITSNVYLMTASTGCMFFGLSGMHIYGGKGVFAGTFTASNTLSQLVVEDNIFMNYSECAIGHLSQDWPHWKIQRNQFHGALVAGERVSFGVVLSGRADGCQIEGNEFQENKVSVKLAVSTNGTVASVTSKNVFERWTTSPGSLVSTDVWIVPTTAAPTVNTGGGVGTIVSENRFGNENLLTTDYHVLVAEENTGAGSSSLNYLPLLTASSKYLGGVQVINNVFYGTGASSQPMVYSTTPNLWAWKFDNLTTGTPISTLGILPAAVTDLVNIHDSISTLRQQHVGGASSLMPAMSSVYAGPIEDPVSLFQSWNTTPAYWRAGYDAAVAELTTSLIPAFSLSNATAVAVTDAAGGNEAVEMTATAINGVVGAVITTPTVGRLGFCSFDIKIGSSLPLPYLRVALQDGSSANPIVDRLIAPNSQWRRVTIPFCMNAASAANVLQFLAPSYVAGVATKIQIGRVRVYHAQEAVHPYTKTLDSGLVAWTPGSISAGALASKTVALVGARVGDIVTWGYDASLNGVNKLEGVVTANDVVTVYLYNLTGGALSPVAGNVRVRAFKGV